jgi:predicted phage-related endonuclease
MSQNEIVSKIEQLKEWEAILEEAQAEVEALKDSIKNEMLDKETEELIAGAYIVRWTSVLSNRFDSTAFKREHADLYQAFTKQVTSKRFSIA